MWHLEGGTTQEDGAEDEEEINTICITMRESNDKANKEATRHHRGEEHADKQKRDDKMDNADDSV